MIANVAFESMEIQAGEDIQLDVDAAYPVTIVIKCFKFHPPPPCFTPCKEAGSHVLPVRETFSITTSAHTFDSSGEIHFTITDAENDQKMFVVTVTHLVPALNYATASTR